MARLSYVDPNLTGARALVERIVAERGSVLHLYQMLLHSPSVTEGWLTFMTAVRHKAALAGALRELAIMRIAVLNDAPYEAEQHAPIALKEGLKPAQLDALADWEQSDRFDETERAVLALTDHMTRHVHVPENVFDAVRRRLAERDLVELVVTIASYNMVSRVLEALEIRSDDERMPLTREVPSREQPNDAAAADATAGPTRVNFFQGQLLAVDDLTAEQHYVRVRLRRHNRFLHGWGVASGLQVRLERGVDGPSLTIEPGLAIDARGEEIELCKATTLALPATGRHLLVQVTYAERLFRPVPVSSPRGEAESKPSRIEESFRAFVAAEANPAAVPLARLVFARRRWTLDGNFKAPRVRATARAGRS